MDKQARDKGYAFLAGICRFGKEAKLEPDQVDQLAAVTLNALPVYKFMQAKEAGVETLAADMSAIWGLEKAASAEDLQQVSPTEHCQRTLQAMSDNLDRVCEVVGGWL